jgi:hypothetical protein
MCTHISCRVALGATVAKLRFMLPSWDMSGFDFHGQDIGVECNGRSGLVMADTVLEVVITLLGVFLTKSSGVRAASQEVYKILSLTVKIQSMILIVCASQ